MDKHQQLRKVIREEIKKVIAEGTRAIIGVEAPNGRIVGVYNHYDGYPQHAGKMLKKYYNKPNDVKDLIKLGKNGISFLDKSMKGGKDHSFANPKDGETIFYGRDRGEKGNMTQKYRDRGSIKHDMGADYFYIYNMKDRKWQYQPHGSDEWKDV